MLSKHTQRALILGAAFTIGALWGANAQADCASQAFWTWPTLGASLPPNGVILLTGYGADQPQVEGIAALKPALTAERGDTIPLEVVEVRRGDAQQTKALLRPVRPLSPGDTYSLTFSLKAPDHWAHALTEARWSVRAMPDTSPPTWDAAPTFLNTEVIAYGCGPGVNANVNLSLRDDSADPLLLDVTLTDASGHAQRMWVEVGAGASQTSLGHGMCSGDFSMHAPTYTATFTALDLALNPSPAPGDPLQITRP